MSGRRKPSRLRHALLAVYLLLGLGALTWPGYAWLGNSIEPYVFGIPFSFAWVVGWVVATFLALLLFDAAEHTRADP